MRAYARAFLRDGGIIHRLTFRIDAKPSPLAMTCTVDLA